MTDWRPTDYVLDRAITGTRHLRSSAKPQWVDARRRLEEEGISPEDAALASWEAEGVDLMCGVIVARDGPLIDFCVAYGYDDSGQPLEKGLGWITRWTQIPEERVTLTSTGDLDSWDQDRVIARMVFELESQGEPEPDA